MIKFEDSFGRETIIDVLSYQGARVVFAVRKERQTTYEALELPQARAFAERLRIAIEEAENVKGD